MTEGLQEDSLNNRPDLKKEREVLNKSPEWGIIIQARMTSSRLHGKILAPISGLPVLIFLVKRFQHYFDTDRVYVALAEEKETELVRLILEEYRVRYTIGSTDDVLKRYIECAEEFGITQVVRATSDDPLTDMDSTARMLAVHLTEKADYTCMKNLPIGAQEEVISFHAMKRCHEKAYKPDHFEHVVNYIYDHQNEFLVRTLSAIDGQDRPDIRITLDTPEDYRRIVKISNFLSKNMLALNLINVIRAYDELFCQT